ncbi:DNA cytosine methyltransferase [Christiangramia fulva]|uniref:DNA (cytosine-5-)-methyltransferase n=1 Tax=Christiangramia fulva TaxID=2126553 RepID=A0A2R3ZA86_9FLAO|nr:DNA cytosine methyltransferase [Christiangramia fulva]AVR47233.1 DNA cytosine methyltransferase [Christiangramia fulva]
MREFVIDLFCGAGGTSAGIHLANGSSKVVLCVNHDLNAIESHRLNHPNAKHLTEDIRNPEVLFWLKLRVNALRKLYPGCIITIWASLECTNFSKAKGGQPRDADSRTLAEHLFMYLDAVDPDYLMIENVIEFMCWGPLDEKGKPLSRKRGKDYLKWVDQVRSYGYKFDWKELNSANYGAYTSRTRYFAQFAKKHLPISWPEQTHAKKIKKEQGLFQNLKPWKPVKEVLNLEHEGKSIFNRKKPLVENTLKRIYAGLVKFVANGDDSFIKKYYSGRPAGKVISINGPAGTITTIDGQSVVKCDFLLKYNSKNRNGHYKPPSMENPSPTVSTQGRLGIINTDFLQSYYGNGNSHSTEEPCPTVSTKDRFGKISTHFIDQQFGNSKPSGLDQPLGSITQNPKYAFVNAEKEPWLMDTSFNNKGKSIDEPAPTVLASRKHHYLMNPQFKNPGNPVNKPAPTVIARQDKKPLGLISCESGSGFIIPVYDEDCETMIKIKLFMAYYGIVDIKMRMLEVEELMRIQGFPEGYQLVGTKTDQKKFIGNSVEVTTAKALFEAHHEALEVYYEKQQLAA